MTAENSRAYQRLHDLLIQLQDAQQMLDHGPKRIAAAGNKVAAAEAACSNQKEQIRTLKKQADQNSLNLKTREAELQKLEGRLNQASSNKEYDIIQTQIATEKQADAELEDNILTLLSNVDDAEADLDNLEAELAETRKKADEVAADVKSKEPGLLADVERLNAEIAEAEKVVPGGEARTTYRRLRDSQGAGGLAKLEDGYCTECNTAATQQDIVQLNLGKFVLCRACGRILYLIGDDA